MEKNIGMKTLAAATAITHPLDVLKVRLQMQLVGQKGPLMGMGKFASEILKSEGPRALYLGVMPALVRSVTYGGLRIGLYEPSKYVSEWAFGSSNILLKVASGHSLGLLQLPSRIQWKELQRIISEEGFKALWKGVGAAMTRAAALTASQMATYDESKRALLRLTPLDEGFHLHLISSIIAGTVSTLVTAPVDMVKTRLMMQRGSKSAGIYKNGFDCAFKVIRSEGPLALYKGWYSAFLLCQIELCSVDISVLLPFI
ncbi:hypothetical protein ACHQM5_025221 [Ranunculus cassubicifolius]